MLDEATASLPGPEVDRLFGALRRIAAAGTAILFISHYLDEVLTIADRVTVLRDGRWVTTAPVSELSHERLANLMLGRELVAEAAAHTRLEPPRSDVEPVLSLRAVGGAELAPFSLDMLPGEVVGIAGLTGSGRDELASLVAGRIERIGEVHVDGSRIPGGDPRKAIDAGLCYVPADRAKDALFPMETLRENLTISDLEPFWSRGRIQTGAETKHAEHWIEELDVRPARTDAVVGELSGGNQQKVVMARWLRCTPRVLVLDEPTQGVDVGSKADIHRLVDLATAQWDGHARLLVGQRRARAPVLAGHRAAARLRDRRAARRPDQQRAHRGDPARAARRRRRPHLDRTGSRPRRRSPLVTTTVTSASPVERPRRNLLPGLSKASVLYLLALILVLFSLWIPETFLTQATFKIVLADQVVIGILGLAVLVPLTAGAFDLSCGAMLAFSLVIMSWFQAETGVNAVLSAVIALAACAGIGFLSGLVVVKFRVNSFIATLGMSQVLAAATLYISSNRQIVGVFSPSFLNFGRREVLGIPIVVYYLVAIALVIWYVIECTPLGRHLLATGSNPNAARLAGVRTDRMVWGSLVVSAVVSGVAGIIYGAKVGSFSNTFGPPLLFPAFAAVFFGSTQFKNRANVWGTIAAVYTLAFGVKGLQLAFSGGVYWITPLFNGLALLVAVALASRKAIPKLRPKVVERPDDSSATPGDDVAAPVPTAP